MHNMRSHKRIRLVVMMAGAIAIGIARTARTATAQVPSAVTPTRADEEGFVLRKSSLSERRHLAAQVIFELFHVGTVDRRAATQVFTPLRDLLFERGALRENHHARLAFDQMPRSVSWTTSHCCLCIARCARPSFVMR